LVAGSFLWTDVTAVGQQRLLADVERPLSIVLTDTNEFVGACGFLDATQHHGGWETWLLLRSKFWGKAIGSEVTSALIEKPLRHLVRNGSSESSTL